MHFPKHSLLVLSMTLFCTYTYAQESGRLDRTIKNIFTKPSLFEVDVQHGFVRPQIAPVTGSVHAYPITGRVYSAGLGYTCNISPSIGLNATGRIGAYPITVGIPETEYSPGQSDQYYMYAAYEPFAELSLSAAFRYFPSQRLAISAGPGVGLKSFANSGYYTQSFSSMDTLYSSYKRINLMKSNHPFLQLNTSLSYLLRNDNLLRLKVSYQYSLSPVVDGKYSIAIFSPVYSTGTFSLSGNQFNVGLGYTFTGYERYQQRLALGDEGKAAMRKAKRVERAKYYTNRMGCAISVRAYGALFASQQTSTDPTGLIGRARLPSFGAGAEFIREFRPNYFWEVGISFHEYTEGFRVFRPGFVSAAGSSSGSNAYQLSLGAGYILRLKDNTPLLYLSGGAALGYATDGRLGHTGSMSGRHRNYSDTSQYVQVNIDNFLRQRTIPLLYVGIRKDIRIAGPVFLSPSFRYHQGLMKFVEHQGFYMTEQTEPSGQNFTMFSRGSYFQYSLGLKVDL